MDEYSGGIAGGGVAAHHAIGVAALLEVRIDDRLAGHAPARLLPERLETVTGVVNGVACGRRIGKLCGSGRYFLCRHCYRLAYQSQREQPHDRALRRANKICLRLGDDPGILSPAPEKPKGMHWRTFERFLDRVRVAEGVAEEHLAIELGRLKAKDGRWNRAN